MAWIDDQLAGLSDDELRERAKHYYMACVTQEASITELVAPALGYQYDEQYGWIVGDHVAESLVAQLVDRYQSLTRQLRYGSAGR